jgi:hypothetical protein
MPVDSGACFGVIRALVHRNEGREEKHATSCSDEPAAD